MTTRSRDRALATPRPARIALAVALLAAGCQRASSPLDADARDEADGSARFDDAAGPDADALDAASPDALDEAESPSSFEQEVDAFLSNEQNAATLLDQLDTRYRDRSFAATLDAVRRAPAGRAPRPEGARAWRWTNPFTGIESSWFSYVPPAVARTPDTPAPLVLFLHWAGGSGDAVVADPAFRATADQLGAILAAPTSEPLCDWSGSERCMSQALSALRAIKRQWRIDDARVALSGFSMGGRGAFSTGVAYPEPWCAVLPVAGSIGAIVNSTDVARHQSYCCPHAENLRDARTLHTIGGADLAIAVAFNQGCAACFSSLGLDARYAEPPGVGHTIEPEPWRSSVQWGLSRPRESYPRRVTYNLRPHSSSITAGGVYFHQLLRDSLYWVAIEARRDNALPARIDAQTDGREITIATANVARLTVFLADEIVPLDQPVRITVDATLAHDALVARDRRLLLSEARRRADRTMTFAAAVSLAVP